MKLPQKSSKSSSLRSLWRAGIILLVVALTFWVFHPAMIVAGMRFGLSRWAASTEMQWQAGAIQMERGGPLVVEGLEIWANDPKGSCSAVKVDRIEMDFRSLWRVLMKRTRVVEVLTVDGLTGVVDLRSGKAENLAMPLRAELMNWQRANLEILTTRGKLELKGLSANFSERNVGQISVESARVESAYGQKNFGPLEGVTAWKGGILYLADLPLFQGVTLDNFHLRFVGLGGMAFGLQVAIEKGSLWVDGTFDGTEVDVALWGSGIELAPLPAFLGWPGEAEGLLQEGRLTFRGDPQKPLDGQASLRISAKGFLWNKRGWETLTVGANLIHRHLVLNSFELRQKENAVTANGEMSLEEAWPSVAKAPFLLNVSAAIKDLSALAALVGPPFDQMSGRMSLSSSLSGRKGRLKGFLSLEATEMKLWKQKFESGRVEVTFAQDEAQVTQCEFWSGQDHLNAKGTIALESPNAYSGAIKARVGDVGPYRDFLSQRAVSPLDGGVVRLDWEGDGTRSAHSGAFSLALDDFISALTPGGLTGSFEGTYSPENVYFSVFDLKRGQGRFTTTATLARSGLGLKNAVLREKNQVVATGEIFLPMNPFAVFAGTPVSEAMVPDKAVYLRLETKEPLRLRDIARLSGQKAHLGGTVRGKMNAEGLFSALQVTGKLEGRDLSMDGSPEFREVNGLLAGEGAHLSIGPFRGQIDGGGFVFQGGADFSSPGAPHFNLGFIGRNIKVGGAGWSGPAVDLWADADVRADGDASGAELAGLVRLRAADGLRPVGWFTGPGPFAVVWGGPSRFVRNDNDLPKDWKNGVVVVSEAGGPFLTTDPGSLRAGKISLQTIFATPQWHRANPPS